MKKINHSNKNFNFCIFADCHTVWKVSKYGVFSGPYFHVFTPNIGKYRPEKLCIWMLFTQCQQYSFFNFSFWWNKVFTEIWTESGGIIKPKCGSHVIMWYLLYPYFSYSTTVQIDVCCSSNYVSYDSITTNGDSMEPSAK